MVWKEGREAKASRARAFSSRSLETRDASNSYHYSENGGLDFAGPLSTLAPVRRFHGYEGFDLFSVCCGDGSTARAGSVGGWSQGDRGTRTRAVRRPPTCKPSRCSSKTPPWTCSAWPWSAATCGATRAFPTPSRLLEITGRADVPLLPGAVFPLVHTRAEKSALGENPTARRCSPARGWRNLRVRLPLPRTGRGAAAGGGAPARLKPSRRKSAANFMVRKAREFPGEVTIIAARAVDGRRARHPAGTGVSEIGEGVRLHGRQSFSPPLDNYFSAEYVNNPRHEFNLWWDPEAARIVLHAPWKKITNTPTDISLKTKYTAAIADRVAAVKTPFTEYLRKPYAELDFPCGTNWPSPRGWTRASSPRTRTSSWTWTSTTARPTATR